jgi:S-layer homology domain/Kelch motif
MPRLSSSIRIGAALASLLALTWGLAVSRADTPNRPAPGAALAAPPNTWSSRAPYPIPIFWQALAAQGGRLYSFGGVSNSAAVANTYTYDPAANRWTAVRPLPLPLYGASAVSDGTAIYIVNGSGHNNLYRYDPVADTYTPLAAPAVATHSQAVVYLGGKIYRIGGFTAGAPTDSVEVYTIATNTWAPAHPYLLPLRWIMAIAANGYIYAAGGFDASNRATDRTARYDPATNTWDDAAVPDLPAPWWGSASALVNGRWLLAGGKASGTPTGSVLSWDLSATGGWQATLPLLPQTRYNLAGAALGATFYSVGGCDVVPCLTGTGDNQEYQGPVFWDVAPSDYYYTPVLYLVAHGVISGYADGTFRPGANTTRGQLAKIVVLAEQWPRVTPAAPHFSDVPPGSPFYTFVETAAARGILSGYSDGTFRPGADVTRGQLSKIIVNAQGWAITTAGGPHFGDVPPGSPFYTFVETAVARGIISGYADHTFRPGNPATRGQIAKIVYLALQAGSGGTATPAAPTATPRPGTPTATPRSATPTPRPTATAMPPPPSPTPTPAATCPSGWTTVSPPIAGTSSGLNGIAALSATDIWAVGAYSDGPTTSYTLAAHWTGTDWTIVPSPNIAGSTNGLTGVAAIGPNDVWAVGSSTAPSGVISTLVEHWNGTSWTIFPSPNPDPGNNALHAVAAAGPNDVWAVGSSSNNSYTYYHTLVEHWNGASWSVVASPDGPNGESDLTGIAVVAANDIWAVAGIQQTMTMHWDGGAWTIVPSPNVGNYQSGLRAVAAVASNDVWAVGDYFDNTDTARTLTEHWDGVQWTIVSSPSLGYDFLNSAIALAPDDVWAVGVADDSNTLVLHWTAGHWVLFPSQSGGGGLVGVDAVSARDLWGVGTGYGLPLVERYYCPGPP